jgi:glycopeptide antibiotics resistance protein
MFGINLLILLFVILCLAAVLAILYQNIKFEFNIKRLVLICAICIGGFIFALRQPYLSEKAHVLEFGLLGWLAMRDLTKQDKYLLKDVLFAFIFAAIIGYLGEGIQKFLPWRVFEVRDIITNVLSGLLGVILFAMSRPKITDLKSG